ncbi:Hypothetical_protein [Hexamita inflata]|uniref:Hypothetical_protein n=1 Tax=Hexamita inflata TaxID=28002 RepID=A0AA86N7L8_9EUKA|nr:Hypothetical protein HINF_LOCUS1978 [Hexamita inflata]
MIKGSVCDSNAQCSSNGCYVTEIDPTIKKCGGYSLYCQNPIYQPVFCASEPSVQCKFIAGQACTSDQHTICVYRCNFIVATDLFKCSSKVVTCPNDQYAAYKTDSTVPQCYISPSKPCEQNNGVECLYACLQVLNTNEFKCSQKQYTCTPPMKPFLQFNSLVCKIVVGDECQYDFQCTSNACYPELSSGKNKCSPSQISCSQGTIAALDSQQAPFCVKKAGEQCQSSDQCVTNACYSNQSGMKYCAVLKQCDANYIQIYVDKTNTICLKAGGQDCAQNDSLCAYGCYLYHDNSYKCAIEFEQACTQNQVGQILSSDFKVKCYLIPGQDCSNDAECSKNACYPVAGSSSNKCSPSATTCTQAGTIAGLDQSMNPTCFKMIGEECTSNANCFTNTCYPVIQTSTFKCASPITCSSGLIQAFDATSICIKDASQPCTTEGVDLSCFSGLCAQVKNDPSILQCVQKEFISVCFSCDQYTKCVINQQSASCLLKNGQINCVGDQCANSCLPFQKQFVCSVQCEDSCDQKKCKTDITGERPSCRSDVSVISGGIIAAIVISVWILVSLMVMLFCLIKRRKQKEQENGSRQSGILRVELAGL